MDNMNNIRTIEHAVLYGTCGNNHPIKIMVDFKNTPKIDVSREYSTGYISVSLDGIINQMSFVYEEDKEKDWDVDVSNNAIDNLIGMRER